MFIDFTKISSNFLYFLNLIIKIYRIVSDHGAVTLSSWVAIVEISVFRCAVKGCCRDHFVRPGNNKRSSKKVSRWMPFRRPVPWPVADTDMLRPDSTPNISSSNRRPVVSRNMAITPWMRSRPTPIRPRSIPLAKDVERPRMSKFRGISLTWDKLLIKFCFQLFWRWRRDGTAAGLHPGPGFSLC